MERKTYQAPQTEAIAESLQRMLAASSEAKALGDPILPGISSGRDNDLDAEE